MAGWKGEALIGGKKETYVYSSLKEQFALEWKIRTLALRSIPVTNNIGQTRIPVGKGTSILFPIFYAIILGAPNGPQALKVVDNRHVEAVSKLVVVGICPFITKLGITAGVDIDTILQSGPVLLSHGFGNLSGSLLALPVAILLSMRREAVSSRHSINREYHMALISNVCGPDSAEARESLSIYIVDGVVGTIYSGLMASVVGMTRWFHPRTLGLGSGIGAGVMMASSNVSSCVTYPGWTDTISAVTNVDETTAGITGMYITMFIVTPTTDKLYAIPESKLGRFTLKNKEGGNIREKMV